MRKLPCQISLALLNTSVGKWLWHSAAPIIVIKMSVISVCILSLNRQIDWYHVSILGQESNQTVRALVVVCRKSECIHPLKALAVVGNVLAGCCKLI